MKKKNDTIFDAFSNYVTKALSELDTLASHLAQNKITNIIFQAQAGLLTQEMQTQRMAESQRNYFHPGMQPGHGMSTSPQPPIYGENSYSL